eukprot:TRINITY_DN16319_c0_g1_i5.p1 TRINITY_DN16319_c0_g1~~TRINITY_DN16319_c0_g1_i5.p1  ORF type:complete len:240 (-),score=60.92 TRINITY_DN16319_c0_g1_i5:475-1194(-)
MGNAWQDCQMRCGKDLPDPDTKAEYRMTDPMSHTFHASETLSVHELLGMVAVQCGLCKIHALYLGLEFEGQLQDKAHTLKAVGMQPGSGFRVRGIEEARSNLLRAEKVDLFASVAANNRAEVRLVCEYAPEKLLEPSPNGGSALHTAAANNRMEIAVLLLRAGADGAERNKAGHTPLHQAAMFNSIEVARLLLESRVDPDLQDLDSRSALALAAERGLMDMVEVIEEARNHWTPTAVTL